MLSWELKRRELLTMRLNVTLQHFLCYKQMFYCGILVWNANCALQIMHWMAFFSLLQWSFKKLKCAKLTFLPSALHASDSIEPKWGLHACIPPHPLLCHETFLFFWHVFQSSSYFDFDLHPFQLLTCSMLVIVLVFPADVQLDNAFTPLEATALETLSFFSSLLLRLFGVGLFISLPATGLSRVPRPLLSQRFLWSRQPGGAGRCTLRHTPHHIMLH